MASAGSSGSKAASTVGLITGRLFGVALTAAIVRADLEGEPDPSRPVERAFEFAIGEVSSEIGHYKQSPPA
jgi:hypothetical protein